MAARRYKTRLHLETEGAWISKDIQSDVRETVVIQCADGESTLITIEPTVCANTTDPQFLVVRSDVEGLTFWGVDAASPTTATAAATAVWTLRPHRVLTDAKCQVWSVSSKYALVVNNAIGRDANVTVIFGRN